MGRQAQPFYKGTYMTTELCLLFEKYRADKCPQIFHSYSPLYYEILSDKRYTFKNILEIGVGTKKIMRYTAGSEYIPGASLRAWADFFPHANIFGLDIDKSVLFKEDRIRCYYTDQSNSNTLLQTMSEIGEKEMDLILDDGSHKLEHMILSFQTLNKFISKDGIYIIEDIANKNIDPLLNLVDNSSSFKIHTFYRGNKNWDSFIAYTRK